MPFFHTPLQQIWMVCMLAVAAMSWWRGRWPERTVAFGMFVASIATALFQNTSNVNGHQWADLLVDVAYFALLAWVALRSDRWWPLWAAAFQLINVVLYVARLADERVGAKAPFMATVIWSYLILIAVVVGVWTRDRTRTESLPSPSTGSSAT
jgi:hypothetical protein